MKTAAIISAIFLTALAFVGCKSVPTVDTMYSTAQAIGYSAGLVANETKIDDKTRNAIVEITSIVASVVPETNQTFQAAWMPIAEAHAAKMVEEGKLDEGQAKLAVEGVKIATMGIDYVFVRYSKAKTYKELVAAAVDGFTSGFLAVFKPVDSEKLARGVGTVEKVEYDKEAYVAIKAALTK